MNMAHLHLILNHFPVIGSLFGVCFLLYGIVRMNETITNAGKVVLVVIALLTIPTYLTGEPAMDIVMEIPEVSMPTVEQHQAAAKLAASLMLVVGAAAFVALLKRFRENRLLSIALLVGAIVTFGLMGRVANFGGQIHHQEIREPVSTASPASGVADHNVANTTATPAK